MTLKQTLEEKGFNKQTIVMCLMVLMLCIAMFFIGYGYAHKDAAKFANQQVQEILIEYTEAKVPGTIGINFSTFNSEAEDDK